MKKYLLGIILFIAGIALMGTGLVMQFTMVPKTTNANNTGSTENGEEIVEEKELQDVSTFDFGTVTGAVLTGQAGGYLVVCDNNSIIPTPVNAMSLNGLLNSIKTATGYRISDNSLSTCAPTSLVIGTLSGTEFSSKILELEPFDNNTLLVSYNNTTYEFVFDSDVSSLISNLG